MNTFAPRPKQESESSHVSTSPSPSPHLSFRYARCSQVDIERFDGAIKEIEASLGTRLFAVATQSGHLDECFWEAQELVASASILLGCPENEQERYIPKLLGVLSGTVEHAQLLTLN